MRGYLAGVHASIWALATRVGLDELIGVDHVYPTLDMAVQAIEKSA